MTDRFELRRLSDGLVYHFARQTRPDMVNGFKRSDGDYWILYRPGYGWIAWDDEGQAIAGRPWNVLPDAQSLNAPPEGEWVSKKGAKSYVYDLVHVTP